MGLAVGLDVDFVEVPAIECLGEAAGIGVFETRLRRVAHFGSTSVAQSHG